MLVLSRHRDESIMIGDDVVVTIVDIRGDKVRLGIEAPQSIPVHRQEVYDAIQRENRRATQTGSGATKTSSRRRRTEPICVAPSRDSAGHAASNLDHASWRRCWALLISSQML